MLRCCTSVVGGWVGWGGILTYQRPNDEDMKGNSEFMIWESQRLPSLESLHLRARHVFVPLVLCNALLAHKHGRKSILVTDGAPCYPKLTSENNLLHEACNHSKGIFCIKKKEMGHLASAHRRHRLNVENFQRCSITLLEHT